MNVSFYALFFHLFDFICTTTLPAGMHVHSVCAWHLWKPEEGCFGDPGIEVTDGVSHYLGAGN